MPGHHAAAAAYALLSDPLGPHFVFAGSLAFHNFPRFASPGLRARDGYCYLDYTPADLPGTHDSQKLSPAAMALAYLQECLYARLTYRVVHGGEGGTYVRVRVYILVEDGPAQPVTELRTAHLPQSKLRQRVSKLAQVLPLLDFLEPSKRTWSIYAAAGDKAPPKAAFARACDSFVELYADPDSSVLRPQACRAIAQQQATPGARLHDMYRQFLGASPVKRELKTSKVFGVTTTLHPLQVSALCRVLELESDACAPQSSSAALVALRVCTRTVYVDPAAFAFFVAPEMRPARGGVLVRESGCALTCLALVATTRLVYARNLPRGYKDLLARPTPACLSLARYCVRSIKRHIPDWRLYYFDYPPSCRAKLDAVEACYSLDNCIKGMTRSALKPAPSSKIVVSSATLLVCAPATLTYWKAEVEKHVDRTLIKVLFLEGAECATLTDYDLVVTSCADEPPLRGVHWRRVLVDSLVQALELPADLQCDYKWIVSTLTPGIAALPHEWPADRGFEKHELQTWGAVFGKVLDMDPWATCNKLWRSQIEAPLSSGASEKALPYWPALQLCNLLNRSVVRAADAAAARYAPSVEYRTVVLPPSRHNVLAYNVFCAMVRINGVTSAGRGEDWVLHRDNQAEGDALATNLVHASTYWTGFSRADLDVGLGVARVYLQDYEDAQLRVVPGAGVAILPPAAGAVVRRVCTSQEKRELVRAVEVLEGVLACAWFMETLETHEMLYFYKADAAGPLACTASETRAQAEKRGHTAGAAELYDGLVIPGTLATETQQRARPQHASDKKPPRHVSKKRKASPPKKAGTQNYSLFGTLSAKVSYIVGRVVASAHKCVVYMGAESPAVHFLGEALELRGVPHMVATSAEAACAFRGDRACRVLLVPAGSSALFAEPGPESVAANCARLVIFLSPVRAALQTAAVERARKQWTCDGGSVCVETLVLKDTLEERLQAGETDRDAIRRSILECEYIGSSSSHHIIEILQG